MSRVQADIYQIIFTVKDYEGLGEFNPSAMASAMRQHVLTTEGVDPEQYGITYETRRLR